MSASRKIKSLVAATCLAATTGVVASTVVPTAAEAASDTNAAGSWGTRPRVRMTVSCNPGGYLRAGVSVDQNTTGGYQSVTFRTFYYKWQWTGTTWTYRGAVWMDPGLLRTGTSLWVEYALGKTVTVPRGYTYTVHAEVNVGSVSHRYYQATAGEFWTNSSTPLSGNACSF